MSSTGSRLIVKGGDCLDGWVGAGGGVVSGGGVVFRVVGSSLREIPNGVRCVCMRTRSSLEYTIPRRRNCRRSRHRQEAIPLILDPIPMADDRPMAEQLQAPTGGFESAIVVPIINAQNFELKSSLINLVQNRIFRGGNDEEPHAHIRHFESITNNQRYPDVPNTTIKLLLFPFSLDGVAKTWLDKEPPNSILTWDDLVSKIFLRSLGAFQGTSKEVSSSWFFTHAPLTHTINSLTNNDQDSLNSAAGGNFLYKSPTEGLQIIENKAKVRCSRNAVMRASTNAPPSSSTSSSSNFEFQQMAAALEDKMTLTFRNEMNEMKNMMKALVPTPVPIKAVEERCTTCGSNHSFNVCPMTRGGYESPVYHDNFQQFQQITASVVFCSTWKCRIRPPNSAKPTTPVFSIKPSQPSTSTSMVPTTLPSNTITNPRCEARAITTRSGLSYTPVPPIPPPLYDENEPLTEKETEPVSSPISPEPSSAQVDNSPPSKEPSKETRLPYPSRVEYEKKGENDKVQIQKFWEMFKKIHVDITLADALILMPKYQKMLKSLLSNKEKLNEMANTPVSENCSAIILKKLPEKLGDPGQFLIPCNFSELKCKALADLGASINLMPFSVYTKLGLPALQSTRMTLELANCSLCVPKGIARDVLVPVGRFTFPADFVVVDFECNYQVPLILGRPFLRTARVLIDVHGEELVIRDGMERIVFKPDGSQDKESIHMMDIYDDRVKDVCEPKSNDSSSTTSTIVEEFESLVGEIIRQKEELKGISDPAARRKACFLDKFRIINQGRVIHSPKVASISAISHIFPNNNLEDSFKMGDDDLNFIPNKELDKEDLIPIPRESKIGKDCDFPLCDDFQSFKTFSNPLFEKKDDFPSRNDESTLKEEVHKETLKSYLNPLFEDDEENISIEVSRQISPKVNSEPSIESLLNDDDDDLFEIDSNNDEWKRILYGEDFERMNVDSDKTKDFDKSSSNVFKSLSDELEPGSSSYVEGNDLDFHISDILFSTINEDKIFNPGIFDNVLPRKSYLTLDVFDPLHPPLMDFYVNS
ncbi:reverse transcriptase domain-containing protein [Tanacetum coccineum]